MRHTHFLLMRDEFRIRAPVVIRVLMNIDDGLGG